MAFPDLAVNLVYTVLCLVPGFVSLQTVTRTTGVGTDLSEFEKSTWSLIGSGASLSLLYFLYVGWMGVATGRVALVRPLDIGWVDLVAVYPVLLLVAVGVGVVTARILGRTLDTSGSVRPETSR
jgi:hypothetical protein